MNRIDELADRPDGFVPGNAIPSKHLVPLEEIIAESVNSGTNSVKVRKAYEKLIASNTEFKILIDLPEAELNKITDERTAQGILRVRAGDVRITPGYDGVYGKTSIFSDKNLPPQENQLNKGNEQISMF